MACSQLFTEIALRELRGEKTSWSSFFKQFKHQLRKASFRLGPQAIKLMLPSDGKTTSTLELNLKFEGATRLSPLMAVTWVGTFCCIVSRVSSRDFRHPGGGEGWVGSGRALAFLIGLPLWAILGIFVHSLVTFVHFPLSLFVLGHQLR